jgi:hypothetical protein
LIVVNCAGRKAPPVPVGAEGDLHRAAWAGEVRQLETRLAAAAPADVNRPEGDSEWTPLHLAAIAGHADAAALLLDRGADPEARGRFDMTPLHWAALAGQTDVVRLLLARGARVDARNLWAMTPLHEAANAKTAAALLDAGAELGAVDDRGMTPLHVARNKETAQLLIGRGASLWPRARDGRNVFMMAVLSSLEDKGVMLYAKNAAVRLRGERATVAVDVRNLAPRARPGFSLAADSPAAGVSIEPARLPALMPGQRVTFTMTFARRPGVREDEHPVIVTLAEDGAAIGALEMRVDTRQIETLEDRGMIPLGRGTLQPAPSWLAYVAYGAVPVIVAAAALLWRRRRRGGAGSKTSVSA